MTVTAPTRPSTATSRRIGYVVGAVVTGVIFYLINVWPGWEAVPFLTDDTSQVLGWVNASLAVGFVANIGYALFDRPWVIALGGLITSIVGLAATVQVLQVFPFDFGGYSFDWSTVIRVLLILAIVGTAIAVIVNLVTLLRQVSRAP